MENPESRTHVSLKRLERACHYVSDLWFPANPELVSKLKASLNQKEQPADLEVLISDIEGDFSLFLYCIKELSLLLQKEGIEIPASPNPVEILRKAGINRIRQILGVDDTTLSRHFFDGMSENQKQRIQEAVLSASTVQVLTQNSDINPELGYSAALLRQTGLTLIAWNYPGVYQRAFALLNENTSLDVAISKILGFSPSLLASALFKKWGLPQEICEVLNDETEEEASEGQEGGEGLATLGSLAKLCQIGEALARANNPEHYPTSRADWEFAKSEIHTRIGPQGLNLIQEAVIENSESYQVSIPHFFKVGSLLQIEEHIETHERNTISSRNPYLQYCDSSFKIQLIELYEQIPLDKISQEALKTLTKSIIPNAHFSGGLVYTLEPHSRMLVPQLKISALRMRNMSAIPYRFEEVSSDIVELAYQSDEPISQEKILVGNTFYSCLAGVLGRSQRIGVLYLEIPAPKIDATDKQYLVHFKALAEAFNDCLNLR